MSKRWPVKQLAEVAEIIMGQAPPGSDCNKQGEGTPFVKVTHFSDITPEISEWTTNPRKMASKSDVLICVVGNCGELNLGVECAIGRSVAAIRPIESLLSQKYLYYFLHQMIPVFRKMSQGTAQKVLRKKQLQYSEIPIPPLEEQQRIVSILGDALENIRANENQIIQKENGARELLQSMLKSTFDGGEGWTETTIGGLVSENIIEKPLDGNHGETHPKKAEFVESGVPFLMASNLKNGAVDCVNCIFITRTRADSLRKGFAKDGDILISHKGTIGRVAELETDLDYVMLTPQITYYRVVDQLKVLPRYLYTYFQSPEFVEQMTSIASIGSTRAYIGITKQLELTFRYPSIEEQKKIIQKFDSLSENVNQIEQTYQQELNSYDELKQSILQEAFSGKLTGGIAA